MNESDDEIYNRRLWYEAMLDDLDDGNIEAVRAAIIAALKLLRRQDAE